MTKKTRILMDGLTFGEGPRWHEGKFYFSDFYSHKVFSLDMDGNSEVIVEVPGQPSGLGMDARWNYVNSFNERQEAPLLH